MPATKCISSWLIKHMGGKYLPSCATCTNGNVAKNSGHQGPAGAFVFH